MTSNRVGRIPTAAVCRTTFRAVGKIAADDRMASGGRCPRCTKRDGGPVRAGVASDAMTVSI
jgi:hypothetical protein